MNQKRLILIGLWAMAALAQARGVVEGPYVGVLPCADCPGVRTELALERDAASGAPRRYWLREVVLDAKTGTRKQEFTAKAQPQSEEAAVAASAAPAPTAPSADDPKEGSGRIEATLDARSTESMGPWRLEAARSGRAERIVIETPQGERSFVRVAERVLQATGSDKLNHPLQLRAGASTPLSDQGGVHVAGMVSRDARGRLALAPCADRSGVYVLSDPAAVIPTLRAALEALDFARLGRAYLEVYGVAQGSALRVTRLARASTDLDCASALPAPLTLAVVGFDGAWSLRADVDGVRLTLPAKHNKPTEHGSTAQPLAWRWIDGRTDTASAVLRSGGLIVRTQARLCRDTLSNTVYGLAAELNVGGQTLSGCAWSAAPQQPH